MIRTRHAAIALLACLLSPAALLAQQPVPAPAPTQQDDLPQTPPPVDTNPSPQDFVAPAPAQSASQQGAKSLDFVAPAPAQRQPQQQQPDALPSLAMPTPAQQPAPQPAPPAQSAAPAPAPAAQQETPAPAAASAPTPAPSAAPAPTAAAAPAVAKPVPSLAPVASAPPSKPVPTPALAPATPQPKPQQIVPVTVNGIAAPSSMQSRRQLEQDQQPNAIPDFAAPQKKQRTVNPMSANGTVAVSTSAASSMPSGLGIPPAAIDAAASINPEFLRAHVRFLSHDLLEGRGTGQRGGDIAAHYIATQFALYGLKPAGDSGSYLQRINFKGIRTVGDQTTVALVPAHGQPIPLTFLEDYVAINQTATPTVDFDAPIVFVGYGVDAPEYKWDDFKNVDLHGKIMLVIVNQPNPGDGSFLGGKALTYYGRWTYKFEQAAKRGAVGVIIIHRTDLASYGWDVVHNSFGTTERAQLADDPLNTLQDAGWVTWDAAAKIFTAAGMDRDKMFASANSRNFKPVVLPVSLKGHIVSQVRSFTSNNVIAQLPGNNVAAGQPDSAVIYTGHYDHLGLGANTTGDNIYNGAADNATGSAIVMELARAWSICAVKPDHSIFFVAVTGEEQGLLGSRYFAMHPPVPAAQISLDLNYDELLPIGDVLSANVSGAERTSFWPTVQETAAAFSLELQPDNMPMAGSYYRSDHFSFARLGIPAFSIGEGSVFVGHPREWGADQERTYNEQHYHQVSDEYSPSMDFSGNARMARFGFVLGWKAAAMPAPLGWQSGDEFEKARTDSGVAK